MSWIHAVVIGVIYRSEVSDKRIIADLNPAVSNNGSSIVEVNLVTDMQISAWCRRSNLNWNQLAANTESSFYCKLTSVVYSRKSPFTGNQRTRDSTQFEEQSTDGRSETETRTARHEFPCLTYGTLNS